jgi:hypothetical protein
MIKSLSRRFHFIAILAVLFAGLSASDSVFAQAPTADSLDNLGTLSVPVAADAARVKSIILKTLGLHDWIVQSANGSTIVANLNYKGYSATVVFHYDTERIDIEGAIYQVDDSGKRTSRASWNDHKPRRWLKYLKSDIGKLFAGES